MTINGGEKARSGEGDYSKYLSLGIELTRWILHSLGVWPSFGEITWQEKCLRIMKNTFFYSLMIFIFIPCGSYLFAEVDGSHDKIKITGPLSFCIMAILKYLFLTLHEDDFRRCIQHIETDWKNTKHSEDESVMIEKANSGRNLANVSVAFSYGAATFYYMAVPLTNGRIFAPDLNITYRPFLFPTNGISVDVRYSPVNDIVLSFQCLFGFVAHLLAGGTCSLAAVCAMHACGQLQVVMNWLDHLVDGREDMSDDLDQRIANIVRHHVRTLSFISLTEKLLNEISLIEIVGCTLNMCLLGYYCIMEWGASKPLGCVTYVIILTSITFNIFIFCYIGELLMEQYTLLGDKSYTIEWYRLPEKKGKALTLIIAMSRAMTKMTAGNLMDLSLNSFSDVIKSSVAYLNMLRTLMI